MSSHSSCSLLFLICCISLLHTKSTACQVQLSQDMAGRRPKLAVNKCMLIGSFFFVIISIYFFVILLAIFHQSAETGSVRQSSTNPSGFSRVKHFLYFVPSIFLSCDHLHATRVFTLNSLFIS